VAKVRNIHIGSLRQVRSIVDHFHARRLGTASEPGEVDRVMVKACAASVSHDIISGRAVASSDCRSGAIAGCEALNPVIAAARRAARAGGACQAGGAA
jgi:hypothetical protein